MHMTVKQIIDRITPEAIAGVLGVSSHSIIAARKAGSFPASWFDVVETECERRGIRCPRGLFNFKSPSVHYESEGSLPTKKRGGAKSENQGRVAK